MKIDRGHIVNELLDFSQEGHGVVIGKPGIGKSYTLGELGSLLIKRRIDFYIFQIDKLIDGSDNAICEELDISEDWVDYLDKIELPENDSKAVLIFDAFDAGRSEELRLQFISQIRKAVSRLQKWNVLVSVRTYDATKSPQLQDIFNPGEDYQGFLGSRYFEIPELSNTELNTAFEDNDLLRNAYESAKSELKEVLKVPFYLNLLDRVLKLSETENFSEIRLIKSQTELLDLFWRKRIIDTEHSLEKERHLSSLTQELVSKKILNCPKSSFEWDSKVLGELLSADIIEEVGLSQQSLAFSHNILFDYAVSRLIIPEQPDNLIEFIFEDNARPFFLRPSFVFLLTRLWHKTRETFWELYNKIDRIKDDDSYRLFNKLIPPSIIALEYDPECDLDEIVTKPKLCRDILQSIRFLDDRNYQSRDLQLLEKIADKLSTIVLWDFAHLLEHFVELLESDLTEKEIVGEVSRKFFKFILNERKNESARYNIDRLGSSRGVRFLCKTFDANPPETRKLLNQVLGMLKEPNFEIWYFSVLCDEVKYLFQSDPNFASTIYKTIYSYTEKSDEKTYMGTATFSMVSNRRQDFNSCYFRLKKHYPKFLESSPEVALVTGLQIVNDYVINHELYGSFRTLKAESIKVDSTESEFIRDLSSTWHDMVDHRDGADIIIPLIEYLEKLITTESKKEAIQLSNTYLEHARVGLTWKKWISFASQHAEIFKDHLLKLALNPIILEASETTFEIGNAFKLFPNFLNKKEIAHLEGSIWKLNDFIKDDERSNRLINKLLNCFPNNLLSKKSKDLISKGQIVSNEPTFKSSFTSEPYTTDRWLSDKGVDVEDQKNKAILEDVKLLEVFNQKWLNGTPQRTDFESILETVENYKDIFKNKELDNELLFSIQKEIAKSIQIISRNIDSASAPEYELFKGLSLDAFQISTKYEPDTNQAVGAYSPTPRIEASGALTNLIRYNWDLEILEAIKTAAKDDVPIVRFEALRNISWIWSQYPDVFWEIVDERVRNETDSFTLGVVISAIFKRDIIEQDIVKVERCITEASSHIVNSIDKNTFKDNYISLLLNLVIHHSNDTARKIIDKNISIINFSRVVVATIFEIVDPKYPANNYEHDEDHLRELFELLELITIEVLNQLKDLDLSTLKEDSEEKEKIQLIDLLVSRVFFALDIKEIPSKELPFKSSTKNKKAFFKAIAPILKVIIYRSKDESGVIVAHTAHYFIETLNGVVNFYPEFASELLRWVFEITQLSMKSGYQFDRSALEEAIKFTEKILADHKNILMEGESLDMLVKLLTIYVDSGWPEALESLWKLDEAFK
ncbi:MAG: hypothetical protein ABJF04_02250 [Reichenbachiella sp.]|uniref:hypothetical protein n=1 Tax=Reichenbachiella sp. TaxID=2184521 RepID=UPI00326545AE